MISKELRKEFLKFFAKHNHTIVPSSLLIPADPSVLFTTAGMQQFKPYYLGEKSPYGLNVASCQRCFRTSDIEEIGDNTHLTFLEMLGNFSFGGYFKKEAIKYAYEFIVKELGLKIDYVSVFDPEKVGKDDWIKNVPEDKESYKIWKDLGIEEIKKEGIDNFWGPTGQEGPCGPTTEIYVNGIEIWNIVFNEYFCDKYKQLKKIESNGVDTGMGLERLTMVCQKKSSVFETDLFLPVISEIPGENERAKRIIADHIKSAVFLISEGILPSNIERGSVLRRILRDAFDSIRLLRPPNNFLIALATRVVEIYKDIYTEIKSKEVNILEVIQKEEEDYRKSELEREKRAKKMILERQENHSITGAVAYDIFSTTRIGMNRVEKIAKELNIEFKEPEKFQKRAKEFQEISRAGAEKKFGGIGKEADLKSARLHTATHLLHAALRQVLGEHVQQMGSDITSQRLRFDFSHPVKMSDEEIKKVTDLVNQKIKENLEVKKEEMSYGEAIKSGALAFFKEKYPEVVSVYSINNFSKEICAGPHAEKTLELGQFKIIKEESSGAGIRRIRGVLQ